MNPRPATSFFWTSVMVAIVLAVVVFVVILAWPSGPKVTSPHFPQSVSFDTLPADSPYVGEYSGRRCNNGVCSPEWGEYTQAEVDNPLLSKRVGEGMLGDSNAHITFKAQVGWEWKWYGVDSDREPGYYLQPIK